MPYSLFPGNDSIPGGIPLSQFTAAITRAVQSSPSLTNVWVIAELSDVRISAGHCYMELIEKNESGQTVAKLRATIWKSAYQMLRQKFYSSTQRDITTGIKALVKGSVNHHSLYGISFNITDIDPSYTLGDLERLRREIILKLQSEGVAFLNKQLSLPPASQRIAVISAEGAAGYGDFINHLQGNSEGFVFYPGLFSCAMQGDKVSESIRYALSLIEAAADMWDCIVIVRGGGATTDLNGFDDYALARAVATCGLPVIVGIGHERDRNVLDEIAHTSLKTPTAVAGFFIDRVREAYDKVITVADKIRSYSTELLRGEERRLSSYWSLVPQLALHRMEESKTNLQSISAKLPIITSSKIGKEQIRIDNFLPGLYNAMSARFTQEELKISNIINLLKTFSSGAIEKKLQNLNSYEALIGVLDPKNILQRGYSITRVNGRAIKSYKQISKEDVIVTTLSDGELKTRPV